MLFRRKVLLVSTVVVCGGSVYGSLAYGLYLRSDAYRRHVEREVAAFLGLPTRIDALYPLTLRNALVRGVHVWLPESPVEIFRCGEAGWYAQRIGDRFHYSLDLRDGSFVIDASLWAKADYRRVLESGLGHDFAELNLDQVQVHDLDFTWRRPDLELTTQRAGGTILFDRDGLGHATLISSSLNDHRLDQPIHIRARFTPGSVLTMHEVQLESPQIPLAVLRLRSLVGAESTRGTLAGTIIYAEEPQGTSVEFTGFVEDVLLAELGPSRLGEPLTGTASVYVDRARAVNGELELLIFRGTVDGLGLGPLYRRLGIPDAGGTATLHVHRAEIERGRIGSLTLSGDAHELKLAVLCRLAGRGEVTGSLDADLRMLRMSDNTLVSAELDLEARPPTTGEGTIDRVLLKNVAERLLGFPLPDFLPKHLEYVAFGSKLLLEGGRLRVLGTHGENRNTILTVRLFGREVGVLYQPSRSFDVQRQLDQLKDTLDRTRPQMRREPPPAGPAKEAS